MHTHHAIDHGDSDLITGVSILRVAHTQNTYHEVQYAEPQSSGAFVQCDICSSLTPFG